MGWVSVVVAALGSSLLTAMFGALTARFRFNRRAELLSSWKDESELADALERESGIEDSQRRRRGKSAFAFAARVELNRKLANELVPSDTWSLLMKTTICFVLIAVGLAFLGLGTSGAFDLEVVNWVISAIGAMAIVMFIVMLIAALEASTVRDTIKSLLIRVLNATPPYSSKYVDVELVAGKAEFNICSRGPWQKIVKNVVGHDVITTSEVFLGNIVDGLEIEISDFREKPKKSSS